MLTIPGYTLVGSLKATGSNLLFRAVRDSDGLPFILKMPMASSGPRESERYRREFDLLQRLSDVQGITRAHACERIHDRLGLLLEEVQGDLLADLTGKPFELAKALDIAISLTSILAELHRRGVIHKDIKPSNIIITPLGEARLIDFGIATLQLVEHVDAAPTPLIEGTLAYMSPEQTGRMNRSVDYRTDLYSLGITLYEMLTGHRPFYGRDALEWFHAHMAVAPPPPIEHVPSLPPVLSAIVLKLMAKVAEERYQSADGLKADLERCRENLRRGVDEDFPPGVYDFPTHFQLPQRLYGRDAQAATLLQGFERVARGGSPELLLVRGYSGIGKSAVVHELHKPVVRQRGFFLSGKFDQLQQAIPYATLAQAIRGLIQQLLAGSDEALVRWRERLQEAFEGQGQILVDMVPQLELVAGKQPPVQELPPSEAQHRFTRLFRKFLGLFATPEHPLVLFLDDLQWADMASLHLIQHLLTHPASPSVLLIGAYRDNEVSPSHPLALALTEMRSAGARMTDVQLEPLNLDQVRQLVSDALPGAGASEVVEPLSKLAHEKTGGNPFFLLQFMLTLHQDGLLVRTLKGAWRWDAAGVQAKGYSDNVVDFMVGKLRQLSFGTQHLLRLAACVGNTFPLQMLGIISHRTEVSDVQRDLSSAFLEGLLVRVDTEQYRFLHDRIQQAAYTLIAKQERKNVHLRIGRLMLESLSPEEVQEKLFDVVGQLNAGAELITSPEERLRVARLNAEAGKKAKDSVALRSAANYFATAFQFLPEAPWETEPALAFRIRLEHATCEFMSGSATEAIRLVDDLLLHTRSRKDTAAGYCLKTDILIGMGDIQNALTCLLEGLALMGMPMSPHPTWEEVEAAHAEVWELLGNRPIESLVDLPLMTDPDKEAVMSLLGAMYAPAFVTDTNLLLLHLSRMVALSLRYGNTGASVNGYTWYGLAVLGHAFKKYHEGYAFGELACALVERHGFTALRGKALYGMEMLSYWTRPLSKSLELVRQAFHLTLQASDSQVAGYCFNHIVMVSFFLGRDLAEVYQESVTNLDFARRAEFRDSKDIVHFAQRHVQQLRGLTPSFDSMSGDDFDEPAFEAGLTPARMSTMRCWYWLIKSQSCFMRGAYPEALEAANKSHELGWSSIGHIQLMEINLFRALALAACHAKMTAEEQTRAVEEMRRHQQQLAEWAIYSPWTFQVPERLVSAELARVTGQHDEALRAYEQAYEAACEHDYRQKAALACELAARFWYEKQVPTIAEAYARKARKGYLRWGARGKVQHMDTVWPHLASSNGPDDSSTDTNSTHIDALAVVKAQQAISEEIVLERLTATLLRIALENAGAQRGALLLPNGDTLSIAALSGAALPAPEASEAASPLPWTVVSYVRRTREHVLINDASQTHPYVSDTWFERNPVRSVLCLPLLLQEEFRGALYLENNLATNAFTPSRIKLLGHLATQAAISIENARLYSEVQNAEGALRRANDELEKRVEERTRELKQTQARLVDTARAAGMAEVASNVLHNVGNILTSAVINLQMMRETVDTSRMGRLKQVTHLFEEHRDRLADFLTKDPRGPQISSYLSALADELLREQSSLQEGMGAMSKHIEHIRAIVQVQQTYARSTLVTEECDLSDLVEDALSIQRPALVRHGISVTQQLTPLSKVWLDKHKVLQILINLISNAKNAMNLLPEEQRHLNIQLEAQGTTARIRVVDSGMGIAPEIRARLFTQGFTTREGGHGLGLHSSALAAKMLGGRLHLESEGPGKGATATLEIPLT
ncbi:trifunctional serine/threonine-protein kinase/ATP-binding protein/sensor histidine kinase [Stigmatella aurantiaca]|uniref:histidine kinase n=1 Tax=Stigmatella aurantiaca (strain DW4/3-1) TaxID=378806 RepID=Q08UX4_STIAD|nr:trifunctional serine/threonine-protein kinase/ATP-binding protein/sensor histidine kinase [Stigmatella aurantiaca]ADO68825.1 Sensor protein [Stigmatella aurantiaca DW4/3-1]EAU64298.1 serine/threonine kinase with two-component sensor domain [Stigmatella aurantiaca DW4/3-1]